MSIARVKTSAFAARKGATLRCQKCGRDIAKGEVYRWWFKGFRARFKNVRCSTCPPPRYSELESSMKADAYAAVESADDALDAISEPGDTSDLESIVTDAGDAVQEVADQYRPADEAIGGGGATVSGEIADELESAAGDLSNFSIQSEDFDEGEHSCDRHEDESNLFSDQTLDDARKDCDTCQRTVEEARREWWDAAVDEARSALSDAAF